MPDFASSDQRRTYFRSAIPVPVVSEAGISRKQAMAQPRPPTQFEPRWHVAWTHPAGEDRAELKSEVHPFSRGFPLNRTCGSVATRALIGACRAKRPCRKTSDFRRARGAGEIAAHRAVWPHRRALGRWFCGMDGAVKLGAGAAEAIWRGVSEPGRRLMIPSIAKGE
jgi:hypothetical protein